MRKLLLATTALLALSGAALADPVFTTNFTIDGCSGTCGPAGTIFGKVTLTDTAAGVDFDVAVLNGNKFNWNGQGHNTFSFSINPSKTITAADVTIQTAGYQFEAGGMEGTFGTFRDDVDHGANGTGTADIIFSVAGINFSDFVKSTDGHPSVFFAIDVLGVNGRTGDIGSEFSGAVINPVVADVPEPSTWTMMILGFCGVVFMRCPQASSRGTSVSFSVMASLSKR